MIDTQENDVSYEVREGEMDLINKFSVKPLTKNDVYVFSLTLCDNEIDRDFERFSIDALKTLSELFVGKTGIFDHSMSGKDQTARIFSCEVVTDENRKTAVGEPYTKLTARAYMLKNEKNKSLIEEINAGIKKETSVGCAVGKSLCSICKKDMRTSSCSHIKGRFYSGKLCHRILCDPKDAYEWSFVAVPAQKEAGVTKSLNMDIDKSVKMMCDRDEDIYLSKDEIRKIYSYIENLKSLAHEGRLYREELICDVIRMGAAALPQMKGESLSQICLTLSLSQLKELKKAFSFSHNKLFPQLSGNSCAEKQENTEFKI